MAQMIRPSDFSTDTRDSLRDKWTAGKIRALVAALAGEEVLVEVDTQTGHAMRGTITGWHAYGASYGIGVRSAETGRTTVFFWANVGTIVSLAEFGRAKWAALDHYRQEQTAALKAVTATITPEERESLSWKMTPQEDGVHVVATDPRADRLRRWWSVSLDGKVLERTGRH